MCGGMQGGDVCVQMSEVVGKIQPLTKMVKDGIITKGLGAVYTKIKYQLCIE